MINDFRGARPQDPRDLIRRLAELGRTKGPSSLPRVRIHAAGTTHMGSVLGVDEHAAGLYVLLLSPEGSLSFLDLRTPFAVTLEDASSWPSLFRDDKLVRWSDDAALSALETKRAVQEVAARFAQMNITLEVEPALIATSSETNNVLRDLLHELGTYLEALDKDDIGRAAKKEITTIAIARDPGPLTAKREGGTFRIHVAPEHGLPERADVAAALDLAF